MADGASFLPRIESVFYAVFDEDLGPRIVHQVPEGLISTNSQSIATANPTASNSLFTTSPTSPIALRPDDEHMIPVSVLSPPALSRPLLSPPQKRGGSSNRYLFNFEEVAKFVIPRGALYGRLVKFATRNHRIIGFPAQLKGNYPRNYFRFNLCFVFDKNADLSCYEPVVRKVSRVLTSCEEESSFLSAHHNSCTIHAILEQLYEDLNSYSETSIQIDEFNSIELKIFPFYPNPPPVKDWQVPLSLINLTRRIEPNWDLTVAKICGFIDGTSHVARIARLADCDIGLTRQAIAHLLYYQVIMMIDIFQYSNMYTLRKSISWLADEPHVREECGPYVRKPGKVIPDWPNLLHLYSRFKPGVTIFQWMEECEVHEVGIDVRRFASFGVVKGFLRRVHRWPILIEDPKNLQEQQEKRLSVEAHGRQEHNVAFRGRVQDPLPTITSVGAEIVPVKAATVSGIQALRKASAAESSLEQLRTRGDFQRYGDIVSPVRTRGKRSDSSVTVMTDCFHRQGSTSHLNTLQATPSPPKAILNTSPDTVNTDLGDSEHSSGGALGIPRTRLSRSPSAPVAPIQLPGPAYPPDLPALLDGEHHTDELCTRFSVGWPVLEQWLRFIGGGSEEVNDFGKVSIIYR
ncbi:nitrogen permease regulator 2-domain-containing protein [Cytidiella melzeri]|nr:nitrogen permease regulator 2-domain-containing protein [Cytidiella melzeri]